MGKKAIVLATACVMTLVVVIFGFYVLNPKQPTPPLDAILRDPSAWVNRTVIAKGNLAAYNLPSPIWAPSDQFLKNSINNSVWVYGTPTDSTITIYPNCTNTNNSTWVAFTSTTTGRIYGLDCTKPWYKLSSGNDTIGVSFSASINPSALLNGTSINAALYGVVRKGDFYITIGNGSLTTTPAWWGPYYIEVETVWAL
jgi:hypothetical protein